MASKVESCLYLVFWSSSLKSLDLCPQLCEPLAGSPNTGMQDPVFSIVCLKVLLVGLLLLCAVDGSVLPIRKVTPSISFPQTKKKKNPWLLTCTDYETGKGGQLTGDNLVPPWGLGIQRLGRKRENK